MERIIGDLRSAGVEGINDDTLVAIILLLSMPESYKSATTALTMLAITDLTPATIKAKLTDFKISQEATKSTQPNNTSASTSNAQVNFIKEKKAKKKKLLPNTPAKFEHPRSNKNNQGRGKGRGRGSAVKLCMYCKLNGHTYDTCWTLQGDKQSGKFSSRA